MLKPVPFQFHSQIDPRCFVVDRLTYAEGAFLIKVLTSERFKIVIAWIKTPSKAKFCQKNANISTFSEVQNSADSCHSIRSSTYIRSGDDVYGDVTSKLLGKMRLHAVHLSASSVVTVVGVLPGGASVPAASAPVFQFRKHNKTDDFRTKNQL